MSVKNPFSGSIEFTVRDPFRYDLAYNPIGQHACGLRILPSVTKVIFNGPATIVYFNDGTKSVVKCCENDVFDYEKGLAMALLKRLYGDEFHMAFRTMLAEAEEPENNKIPASGYQKMFLGILGIADEAVTALQKEEPEHDKE